MDAEPIAKTGDAAAKAVPAFGELVVTYVSSISADRWTDIFFWGGGTFCTILILLGRYYFKSRMMEKMHTESEARYEAANARQENEKRRADELQRTLDERANVANFKHWLYFPADTPPRQPICPVCHADGRDIRLGPPWLIKDIKTDNLYAAKYICPGCQREYTVNPNDFDPLNNVLEDR